MQGLTEEVPKSDKGRKDQILVWRVQDRTGEDQEGQTGGDLGFSIQVQT